MSTRNKYFLYKEDLLSWLSEHYHDDGIYIISPNYHNLSVTYVIVEQKEKSTKDHEDLEDWEGLDW